MKLGDKCGKLTIVFLQPYNAGGSFRAVCLCGESIVAHFHRWGRLKSCGQEGCKPRHIKHGFVRSNSPEYTAWKNLRDRCNNPKNPKYPEYGGRGIFVSPEWDDFRIFLKDMGYRPSPIHSIDRIDVNGGYEGKNCRWATRKEQNRNRRHHFMIEFRGERLCLMEWAERMRLSCGCIRGRLARGWSAEKALSTPCRAN